MSMEIFTSNNLNILAATFARHYQKARQNVFAPDTIIVQSLGMQRWLSMQISRYCSICANINFLFPNNFFKSIIDTLFKLDTNELAKNSREATAWVLMRELPKLKNIDDFAFINNYLKDDAQGLKLYQISHKLADLYDQYALFRPLWLKSWPEADAEQLKNFAAAAFSNNSQMQNAYVWQALLWQRCLMPQGYNYLWPFLINQMVGVMSDPLRTTMLPKEIFVFGVSYLPPLYVDLLHILSRHSRVCLFLLNPCNQYWGDTVSQRQERAIQKEFYNQKAGLTPNEIFDLAHMENGNRLLANWGGLGKQLFQKIWEMDLPYNESFVAPGCDSMLHALQSDILAMRGRRQFTESAASQDVFNAPARALPFDVNDRSLQVHVCHGPLREIEVLHDNLLDMFSRDPMLKPEDVIVIAPDINVYEPYISAVFASRAQNNCRLAFSVSDKVSAQYGLAGAFFMLLDVNKTRFEVDKILALLEIDYIRASFNMELKDLPQIEQWLKAAQIRWGLDAKHKSRAVALKETDAEEGYVENTWLYGLKRLLLTCAIPGFMQQNPYCDILSIDDMDFAQKPLLGNLLNFFEALKHYYEAFLALHTPQRWQSLLLKFLDTFFAAEMCFAEKNTLQKALQNMVDHANSGGFTGTLHLETVRKYLQTCLENANFERGFLSHGVTFCSAKPMRSIPFKVVCFLGMDLESFPTKEHGVSFDLMARNRQRGDRSKRLDDKYLFLEALISAQNAFYVSYTGYNMADDAVMPPSVLLSELLETVADSFAPNDNLTATDHIVTVHKMHAFDNAYFSGTNAKFFSFSYGNHLIAQGRANARTSFISPAKPLSAEDRKLLTTITPRDFAAFFINPAKAFAQKRLNINFDFAGESLSNKEPFKLNGLEGYAAQHEILDLMLQNVAPEQILYLQKQRGSLPHGNLGPKVLNEIMGELDPFARRIREHVENPAGGGFYAEYIDIGNDYLNIKGPLPVLCRRVSPYAPLELCFFSFSKNKAEHKLAAWLYHLLTSVKRPNSRTLFLDRTQALEFTKLDDPDILLNELSALYLRGLEIPLPFFPKTGLKFCEAVLAEKEDAKARCLTEWHDSDFKAVPGESADSYVKLCFSDEFGEELPLGFDELALNIYRPFFKHQIVHKEDGA